MGTRSGARALTVGALVAAACLSAPAASAQEAPPAPLPSVELPAGLDGVLRDYERRWEAGDAEGLAMLFTADGTVTGEAGWIRGREAIARKYAAAGGPLRLRAVSWASDGDAGWIVGAYGYALGGEATDRGMFVLALRRGPDGEWLIAADLDRGN